MTRPAPTVTVPVETQECARLLVQELTPDQGQTAGRAFGLAVALQSMLAAAPAAPQAAGVGEKVRDAIDRLEGPGLASNMDPNTKTVRSDDIRTVLSALRAPSREPEGGAVWFGADDYEPTEAMIDAGMEHCRPGNHANMIDSFKAMMEQAEIDGLISYTPARATREEAPAEAGERGVAGVIMDGLWPILGGNHMDAEVWNEIGEVVSSALRAQPQARSGEGQ